MKKFDVVVFYEIESPKKLVVTGESLEKVQGEIKKRCLTQGGVIAYEITERGVEK
ncbi:MAG: hypothetical protein IJO40_03700 [Thermoguttaceae bacterium]|jgi:hypothetical protein|nr:hypothetical protein [Thermoguttaceae bacterium]